MNNDLQQIAALLIVAGTVALLVRSWRKNRTAGCGGGTCGALSRDAQKLRAKLGL